MDLNELRLWKLRICTAGATVYTQVVPCLHTSITNSVCWPRWMHVLVQCGICESPNSILKYYQVNGSWLSCGLRLLTPSVYTKHILSFLVCMFCYPCFSRLLKQPYCQWNKFDEYVPIRFMDSLWITCPAKFGVRLLSLSQNLNACTTKQTW